MTRVCTAGVYPKMDQSRSSKGQRARCNKPLSGSSRNSVECLAAEDEGNEFVENARHEQSLHINVHGTQAACIMITGSQS